MEQITYRKTLDVHKNGIQFLLQGFETADRLSRVVEISLMASGDAIDFPLERITAMMYVTTPNAKEPSVNACTIKDNKVVYEVLPIVEEGITTMQLKLIETSVDGAKSVLASPKFNVEVTKSNLDDESAEQTTTFTALEDAVAKAKAVYDERFLRMELTNDCVFKAYYADGSVYSTDILKKLFYNGNVLLSESYAHGNTGTRIDEDTDNSMYYSNVSKSEVLKAKSIMETSEEVLEEVKLHGMYTAFSVDFETGEVEYVSPSFKFNVNLETGELDAEGQSYTFEEEIYRLVEEWLASNGVVLSELEEISKDHSGRIETLETSAQRHENDIKWLREGDILQSQEIEALEQRVMPVALGGTGSTTAQGARNNLGLGLFSQIDVFPYDGVSTDEDKNNYPKVIPFNKFKPKVIFIHNASVVTQPIPFGVSTVNSVYRADSSDSYIDSAYFVWTDNDVTISYTKKNYGSLACGLNKAGYRYTVIMFG